MSRASWSFIIVAGGSGSRIGGTPKQFRLLGGTPLWKWSARVAEKLWRDGLVDELILVLPAESLTASDYASGLDIPVITAAGGQTRSESVANGLKEAKGSHVMVHDAARPFITEKLCIDLMETAAANGSAVPLLEAKDSLKKHSQGKLICVDRKDYLITQTPQAFEKDALTEAIGLYGCGGTDEAEAWTAAGREIFPVEGLEANFKITTEHDWERAISQVENNKELRTGHGYDIHRLVQGRRLVLAGIEVKNSGIGLLGHSDADVVLHTVMDALLGAAGAPDIGTLFPASDQKWKDADGMELLKTVVERVRSSGWKIEWVDITLEAQSPKLGHLVPLFVANVSPLLNEEDGRLNFNIKIKSAEGCGAVGRNECMVCHGVATLSRRRPAPD